METVLGEGENSNGLSCTCLSVRGLQYPDAAIYTLHLWTCCRSSALPLPHRNPWRCLICVDRCFKTPGGLFCSLFLSIPSLWLKALQGPAQQTPAHPSVPWEFQIPGAGEALEAELTCAGHQQLLLSCWRLQLQKPKYTDISFNNTNPFSQSARIGSVWWFPWRRIFLTRPSYFCRLFCNVFELAVLCHFCSPAPRAGQGNAAKFPFRSSQGALSWLVLRVKVLLLCCPLVLLCFQGESLCRWERWSFSCCAPAQRSCSDLRKCSLGKGDFTAAVSCSEFYMVSVCFPIDSLAFSNFVIIYKVLSNKCHFFFLDSSN